MGLKHGVFVVGTDTEVGKTVVTAGLVHVLKKNGMHACSFKAVQSGSTGQDGQAVLGDTEMVKKIACLDEDEQLMNPYKFTPAVSPHLAARMAGVSISREKILNSFKTLSDKYDYIIAEGAGGLIVPIIEKQYFIYDLIKDLGLPVVIVSKAGVGAINHAVLTVKYAESINLNIRGIIINRFSGQLHETDNIDFIKTLTGKQILAVIDEMQDFDPASDHFDELKQQFEAKIDIRDLLGWGG